MEPQYVLALIIGGLGSVAFYLIRDWKSQWEDRLMAQDERLDNHSKRHGEHDVNHATIVERLDHIKSTAEATSSDVKELLKQSGQRATS